MLKKKNRKRGKVIKTRIFSGSPTHMVKKAVGGSWRPKKTALEIEQERIRRQEQIDKAEAKKDDFVSKYGEPNHVLYSTFNTYYWFDLGYKLQGQSVSKLKLKKSFIFWGEEQVYEVGSNSDHLESDEVQMAYKWFIAENILME